jgi:hypothetical protein
MAGGELCGRWGFWDAGLYDGKKGMWQREVQVDNLMRLVGGKNWRDHIAPQHQ